MTNLFHASPLWTEVTLSYCLTTAPHPPLLFFRAPAYLLQNLFPWFREQLYAWLLSSWSTRGPNLMHLHHAYADEKDRADRYLNTGCSVEHGKLYRMWMVQTNLFTVAGNLSALGGFPLGSPRPDLRLSARTNAGLGSGGAPRELSCHRLLLRPAFTWT